MTGTPTAQAALTGAAAPTPTAFPDVRTTTMRLTNLADHLRLWGLDVHEEPGWKTRGNPFPAKPAVVVAHHTATARSQTSDYPSLRVVRDGRSDLPGPLSQLGLGYSGKVYVIASGIANHAGKGAWRGVDSSAKTVGIEAESPGDGTWTAAQRRTYPLLCAALCDLLSSPASLVCGHREWALPAGRKIDPTGIDLNQLRSQTAVRLQTGPAKPPSPTPAKDDDMQIIRTCPGAVTRYFTAAGVVSISDSDVAVLRKHGVPVENVAAKSDYAALVAIHERLMGK